VPGVTTRTTWRSTGPFDFAGSPICAEAAQVERAELVREQARGARELEMPRRAHAYFAERDRADVARLVFGD